MVHQFEMLCEYLKMLFGKELIDNQSNKRKILLVEENHKDATKLDNLKKIEIDIFKKEHWILLKPEHCKTCFDKSKYGKSLEKKEKKDDGEKYGKSLKERGDGKKYWGKFLRFCDYIFIDPDCIVFIELKTQLNDVEYDHAKKQLQNSEELFQYLNKVTRISADEIMNISEAITDIKTLFSDSNGKEKVIKQVIFCHQDVRDSKNNIERAPVIMSTNDLSKNDQETYEISYDIWNRILYK